MLIPEGLIPLVDTDIIRYEIGWAAEVGWKAKTGRDESPPFSYVEELLQQRLADICFACRTTETPRLFFTTGKTFRYDLAKKKPYKATRVEKKPFHFDNLTVYLRDILGAEEVTGIEADDKLAIEHTASKGQTILVSRDKDCRQVPGYFYSWENHLQPSWGPALITKQGDLKLTYNAKGQPKLSGSGYAWFIAQTLMGDPTDNIPGLEGWGPVKTYEWLQKALQSPPEPSEGQEATALAALLEAACKAYSAFYGPLPDSRPDSVNQIDAYWEYELLEQARLTWLVRRLNKDGSPQIWEWGLTE